MRYYLWVLLLLSHREKAAWENPPFRLGWLLSLQAGGERVLLLDCDAGLRSLDRMTGTEEALVFDSSDVVAGPLRACGCDLPVRDHARRVFNACPGKRRRSCAGNASCLDSFRF